MKNKVIILKKKPFKEMKAWEKIFFMFHEKKESCYTLSEIAEKTTSYCKLTKGMSQGTVSKALDVLTGTIVYEGKSYTLKKLVKKDFTGRDTDKKCYRLATSNELDTLWEEGKSDLVEGRYLVRGKLCVVSKYVYIFKLNGKRTKKRTVADDEQQNTSTAMRKRKDDIKKVKGIFEKMMLPDCLFDVSYFDGNIVVMLNSQNKKSSTFYSDYFKDFWKN